MSWSKKQADPVAERERDLNQEIAALEAQINKLNSQIEKPAATQQPRLRSTALPHGATVQRHPAPEPVFEDVNQDRLKSSSETVTPAEHFNDLGVRKYDLAGLFTRIKNQFVGPTTSNPRLVNYLAAGGVQGLRPMRYEKRVSRNRFVAFTVGLLAILIGTLCLFLKNH